MRSPRHGGQGRAHDARETSLTHHALAEPLAVPPPPVPSRVTPPVPPPTAIRREALLPLLLDRDGPPVVAITAPPGYGKTTLLAQWLAADDRPAAWLALDELDNDPAALLRDLVAALERVGLAAAADLGPTVQPERILGAALPRLARRLHDAGRPAILVLDDVHLLEHAEALDVVATLVDYLPAGWRVALGGRFEPALPLARLRAERRLLDVDLRALALTAGETEALVAAAGHPVSAAEAAKLTAVTEGWAAGIYLAMLAASAERVEPSSVVGRPMGPLAAYLRSEVSGGMDPADATFLARSSVLDEVTPAAAAAVTGMPDAGARLARLAEANLLIAPVSAAGRAWRYHHVLRSHLASMLERTEPALVPELHRRAAVHHRTDGAWEEAVRHAFASGDRALAAELVTAFGEPMLNLGRGATLDGWLEAFSDDDIVAFGPLAIIGAWIHLLRGRPGESVRFALLAERATWDGPQPEGGASFESQRALLRAVMVRDGPEDALRNARFAADREPPESWWHANAQLQLASGLLMTGDDDGGMRALEVAAAIRPAGGAVAVAQAILASQHLRRGDWLAARRVVADARRTLLGVNFEGLLAGVVAFGVSARIAALDGDHETARGYLVQAQLVRSLSNHAAPWHSVHGLLELARGHLAVSDPEGARVVLREAEQIVERRPALGTLNAELAELRRVLEEATSSMAGSSTLTAAELRIVPLLPTHLTFGEIADRLHLSRNTVKTHAMSIYGKLWASSRSEAVDRAVELGLLEPYPILAPDRE